MGRFFDWMSATQGNPVADVARSSVVMSVGQPPPGTRHLWLIEMMRRWFHSTYLQHYFRLHPLDRRQFAAWRVLMAADFLCVCIPTEQERLVRMAREGLASSEWSCG